jgi:fatty acid desaturase
MGGATLPTVTVSEAQGEVCIANISPRERRRRLVSGIVPLVIALVVLAVLMAFGVSRWWRLLLLPLFWVGATGFFQWRDKT